MLFDLRGGGRRRTIQVIYLSLALLMGGGLVLFGIGGDVQGGLFDAFSQNQGDAFKQAEERRDEARQRTEQQPRNPAAWASLAETEFQLAAQSEGYDETTGQFAGDARERLAAARDAWQRHLELAGDDANNDLAATMVNALTALGDLKAAVRAQEVYLDGLEDPGFGDFARLAQLAYAAGQTRKGDLAADRAVELAPEDERDDLETQLEALKNQAGGAGGQGAAAPEPEG